MIEQRHDIANRIGHRSLERTGNSCVAQGGLWTCTQFWRTGEEINTGESVDQRSQTRSMPQAWTDYAAR